MEDLSIHSPKSKMEQLLEDIDKEKNNRFKDIWLKIDKGSKLNRIHLFVKKEKIRLSLDDTEEKQLQFLLSNLLNSGSLNKSSEIEYCSEKCEIKSIKNF